MRKSIFSIRRGWQLSLRMKVVLVYGVPILLTAMLILFSNYSWGKKALEDQARNDSIQMSSAILASLKHTMMVNDHAMMEGILTGTSQQGNIQRIWVVDLDGKVQLSNLPDEVQTQVNTQSMGCIECHQYPAGNRPRSQRISNLPGIMRVVTPINNEAECVGCHQGGEKHLGVLITDVFIQDIENQILSLLQRNLILSIGLIILGMIVILALTNLLIVRRIQVMQRAMNSFEDGDYSVRITQNWRTEDELTRLAKTFNRMAASIARHDEEQKKITNIRQQAIVEERERIARELHDGVSQFLGYVNTKIMAIRRLIDKDEKQAAQRQIDQISQAVQSQSVDVRASIIGLKLAEYSGDVFAASLRDYVQQFNQISDLPVELTIDQRTETIKLQPEVELHLMRIVQEAISNVRKHAQAKIVRVKLMIEDDRMVLTIHDDGVGFNPWEWNLDHRPHFGLQSMRERANLAGGEFSLESKPGIGTTVSVQIRLEKL
jgi:signal transduction histidine kinase